MEGGDSNSCREEDGKWRAVVFVAIEPYPQRHDGNVFDKKELIPRHRCIKLLGVITFP